MMEVSEPLRGIAVLKAPSPDWDSFVSARPRASVYLQSGWATIATQVFAHQAYFVEARDENGVLTGVLPLVHQRTFLGNFLTSVAFFNYGGAFGDTSDVVGRLMRQARQLAQDLGCSYLELRDSEARDGEWIVRTDKVAMLLSLPTTFEELSKQLGSKLRSQVRRAERESPSVRVGSAELIDDFYKVFAENMRDLGTPVFPKRFFSAVMAMYPQKCRLVVVYRKGAAAAAGLVVIHEDRAEIPWASCSRDAKSAGFNMKLYWEVLKLVIDAHCSVFDFGRSTINAGTYHFKRQWGAQASQLYWHRWERRNGVSSPESARAETKAMRYAVAVWKRLPVGIANALGPLISPALPW